MFSVAAWGQTQDLYVCMLPRYESGRGRRGRLFYGRGGCRISSKPERIPILVVDREVEMTSDRRDRLQARCQVRWGGVRWGLCGVGWDEVGWAEVGCDEVG